MEHGSACSSILGPWVDWRDKAGRRWEHHAPENGAVLWILSGWRVLPGSRSRLTYEPPIGDLAFVEQLRAWVDLLEWAGLGGGHDSCRVGGACLVPG